MLRRFGRDQRGGAAVEFGLIAPLLAILVVGIGTTATKLTAQSRIRQAVSTGAQYAMTNSPNVAQVQAVTLAAWSGKPGDGAVTVAQSCTCGSVSHACDQICTNGDYPAMSTSINATATFDGETISASQTVRTR